MGIGGVFFKAKDRAALAAWYRTNLGIDVKPWHGATIRNADDPSGVTVWSVFPEDTTYFAPSTASLMINYRVRDLAAMRAQLMAAGVVVDAKVDVSEYGSFGWAMDPEGNRFELWEPPK